MLDAIERLQKLCANDVSGATALAGKAAAALSKLESRSEVMKAARLVLRSKPAMAPLWHLLALAYEEPESRRIREYASKLRAGQASAAANARWVSGGARNLVVATWSDASALTESLEALSNRISEVRCGLSEPGGEGRKLANRLRRRGINASTFVDSDVARALDGADLALMGADSVGESIGNKVGSRMFATVAAANSTPVYVIASAYKALPTELVDRFAVGSFEALDASMVSAVITEHGPWNARKLREAAARISIPEALIKLAKVPRAGRATPA